MHSASVRLTLTALITAAAVALTGVAPANATPRPSMTSPRTATADVAAVNIADPNATAQTRSLFAYLDGTRGNGILFGHQHDLDNGITFQGPADGTKSDIAAGTGDYPAVFGFDTLTLEGLESPGKPSNTPQQNVAALAASMQDAHRLGGIPTLSAHMRNFVTGNNFNDASGRVVSQILPGAPKNAEFNAYLDLIAETANDAVADDGTLIPIIFRPFHENTGSWFWWGAAHATAGEYKAIFRYTVEYLRDTKGVSNLLYAYSPNGGFGGDSTRYLATYPGDAWVDILGYDSYEASNDNADSSAWIASAITDLAMISDLADARGKIAAFTEFGRNGDRTIRETGNKSLNYYTDMLTAIKSDPKASRMAYMLTWSNWGLDQFYIPYPAYGDKPAHEMYPDFVNFYDDPFSVFASNIPDDALTRETVAATPLATVSITTPADGVRVTTPSTTVRVKTTAAAPTRVYFTAGDESTQHELTLASDGYYTGEWQIGAENLDNRTVTLTAVAEYDGSQELRDSASIILGAPPLLPLGVVDDFEGYSDDTALRAAYAFNSASPGDLSLADVAPNGNGARFAYDFAAREYGGFGKVFPEPQDWSAFNRLDAWMLPDGQNQKLVFQMKAGGQTFEYYPSMAGTDPTDLSIHFGDFRPPSWDTANADKRLTQERMRSVTEFYVYINKVGDPTSGAVVLDDIKAVAGAGDPLPADDSSAPQPKTGLVDDFEGYGDDAALQAGWAGRDNENNLSLSTDAVGSGSKAAAFAFDFSSVTYAGIAKSFAADWSGFDRLTAWMKPDGSGQQVVFQFKAGGVSWEGYTTLTGTAPVTVSIPFADVVPAAYQGFDPAKRPTAAELADVQELAIFVSKAGTGTSDTGVVIFDDIQATNAPVDQSLVDDFESYADDAALQSAWAGRDNENDLSLSTAASEGAQAAEFTYDFSSVTYAGVAKSVDLDWSAYNQVGLSVIPDGSGNQLVVQFKAGGVVYEGYAPLAGTTAERVEMRFADAVPATYQGLDSTRRPSAAELADIQEVAIFLTKAGAATSGSVTIDDIRASVGVDVPDPEPAVSKTTVSVSSWLTFSWKRVTVRISVASEGDNAATGEVTVRFGSQSVTADLDSDGNAVIKLPKLRRGLYTITASYAGDDDTQASTSKKSRVLVLL